MTRRLPLICLALTLLVLSGCGTTKGRIATQQLVASDAVDNAVMSIDFRPLAGKTVYLDTTYLKVVKAVGFVNADYVISSLRQQMNAAGCRLQKAEADAELIVEARVGTLGSDSNEVVYGMPASSALSSAASLVPNAPVIPQIPEISVARKEAQYGAAKLALFAYDRETRRAYWQSGTSRAKSISQDVWVFGAGPFQRGTIVDGMQLAGSKLRLSKRKDDDGNSKEPMIAYEHAHLFLPPVISLPPSDVRMTSFALEATRTSPPAEAQNQAASPMPENVSDQPNPVSERKPDPGPEPPATAPATLPTAKPVSPEVPPEQKPAVKPDPAK
ncbi:MAG: DUF6655 family protein [Pirellulaceae bacterium]